MNKLTCYADDFQFSSAESPYSPQIPSSPGTPRENGTSS